MASKLNISLSARNAGLKARYITAVGASGKLALYDGTQPASPETAVTTQTKLVEYTLSNPFAPDPTLGVISPTLPANVNGAASGTPTWFRVSTSGGTAVYDGSVATSGADLNVSGAITSGLPVQINSWSHTDSNTGH